MSTCLWQLLFTLADIWENFALPFFFAQWQVLVTEMEDEMTEISKAANLFEVSLPDFRQLKACRREIVLLKILWDMIVLVRTSFQEWTKTLWREINVEQLDMDCKKFVKDIRLLDKEMRSWDAFLGLESSVKNMVTSLRAVGELQNPAIRDRHWQQLMQATKVSFNSFASATILYKVTLLVLLDGQFSVYLLQSHIDTCVIYIMYSNFASLLLLEWLKE